jgi:hypothetical protein
VTIQAIPRELQNSKKEKLEMKKIQTTNILKVRKALTKNHNESTLKVRKSWSNHNQTVLKVCKVSLKERWILFVYANCRGLTMNHNQTVLKVRKGVTGNHNESALKVRKGWSNHNETALKVRNSLTSNHNETALKVCK